VATTLDRTRVSPPAKHPTRGRIMNRVVGVGFAAAAVSTLSPSRSTFAELFQRCRNAAAGFGFSRVVGCQRLAPAIPVAASTSGCFSPRRRWRHRDL
jgi:hypothetical protein